MVLKNVFLRGTILLTLAGLLSRFLGFFYRIFLANSIGAEGVGIYQLIFPIYGICFALCASGIETSVSKLTAEKYALGNPNEAFDVLKCALLLTLVLSLGCSIILYQHAEIISNFFLKEPRCTLLLRILAFTVPFGTCQSCICGYYFGKHQAAVPSFAQLIEQGIRILSTFLLCKIYQTNGMSLSPAIAIIGLVSGELFSLLFTFTCLSFYSQKSTCTNISKISRHFKEIYTFAAPLTLSRICVTLLASLEAALIPLSLRSYGMNTSSALEIYGILTGMSLPLILFPNAITGSISLMLLPKVSELYAGRHYQKLMEVIHKTYSYCFVLGIFCMLIFLIFGPAIGGYVFHNEISGKFITSLSWICPFLYLNGTLGSVLNGLGQTNVTFFNGIFGLLLRILLIILTVPHIGISGYLSALLTAQIFITCSSSYALKKFFSSDVL